jgi:hypothetical protein
MQQRQPRLGDIVDDYCPRERRITNHAVVAMVGDDVRQTRCVTCDSEHEFKQAKVPPQRRKKEGPGALYQQVLAGMPRKVVPTGLEAVSDNPDDADLMTNPESELIPDPAEPASAAARRNRRPGASPLDSCHVATPRRRPAAAPRARIHDAQSPAHPARQVRQERVPGSAAGPPGISEHRQSPGRKPRHVRQSGGKREAPGPWSTESARRRPARTVSSRHEPWPSTRRARPWRQEVSALVS